MDKKRQQKLIKESFWEHMRAWNWEGARVFAPAFAKIPAPGAGEWDSDANDWVCAFERRSIELTAHGKGQDYQKMGELLGRPELVPVREQLIGALARNWQKRLREADFDGAARHETALMALGCEDMKASGALQELPIGQREMSSSASPDAVREAVKARSFTQGLARDRCDLLARFLLGSLCQSETKNAWLDPLEALLPVLDALAPVSALKVAANLIQRSSEGNAVRGGKPYFGPRAASKARRMALGVSLARETPTPEQLLRWDGILRDSHTLYGATPIDFQTPRSAPNLARVAMHFGAWEALRELKKQGVDLSALRQPEEQAYPLRPAGTAQRRVENLTQIIEILGPIEPERAVELAREAIKSGWGAQALGVLRLPAQSCEALLHPALWKALESQGPQSLSGKGMQQGFIAAIASGSKLGKTPAALRAMQCGDELVSLAEREHLLSATSKRNKLPPAPSLGKIRI